MLTNDALHRLVDLLPEEELDRAGRFLQVLQRAPHDSLARLLLEAPEDDEPTTAAEDEGAAEARAELARGQTISATGIKQPLLA